MDGFRDLADFLMVEFLVFVEGILHNFMMLYKLNNQSANQEGSLQSHW